ncbi:hypothetical protein HZA56_16895 [Candidatus Poribacteria bacterium]|nr:hypothetical protein [Candidatus Poribacteria bacterium]
MGIWDKLTGKKDVLTEAELTSKAEGFFHEVEQLIQTNPKSAMKLILKRQNEIEPVIDFGARFHERFANTALRAAFLAKGPSGESAVERTFRELPSVTVITDHEADTLAQVVDVAQNAKADVIFLRYLKRWPADTLSALEALFQLAVDPSALFIIHAGPNNLFIRKAYLLSVAPSLKREMKLAKVPDELFYFGESQPGVKYDDNVPSAYGMVFCKFYRSV